MKTRQILLAILPIGMFLTTPLITNTNSAPESQQRQLRRNFRYTCNGETIVISRCRKDSDMPGYPPTKPEDDYCAVHYPDRPLQNGISVEKVELREDVIKKLEACGAFQDIQAPLPQVSSKAPAAAADPDVEAANVLTLQGVELQSRNDKPTANKLFDAAIGKYKAAISRGSDLYRAHVGLGVVYNQQEKYDLAIPVWKKAISLKPNNADDVNHLGIALLGLERFADAIATFEQAVRLKPKYAVFRLNLGTAYLRACRLEEAHREAGILSDLDPALALKLGRRLTAYQLPGSNKCLDKTGGKGDGKLADATAASQPAAVNRVAIGHYEKGKQFYDAKDYAKAIPELEQAIAMNLDKDRLAAAYVYLGDSYNSTRQYAKTISTMPQAIMLVKNPPFYMILGNAYERTLQFPKAMAAFKEAVRLNPREPVYLYALGTDYVLNNRSVDAKKVYDTLLPIDANEAKYLLDNIEIGNKQGPVGILVKLAQLGLIGRDTDEALEWFRNALRLNPTNTDVLFDIGSGLDICGEHEEALAVYRRLLTMKLTPKDLGTAHYFIGQTYNEMKNFTKALPELIEANRLNPGYYSKNEIGITYFSLKQYPKALTAFQEAIKLRPTEGDAHLMIGRTYAEMNQPENAIAAFNELIRLEPKRARGYVEIGRLNYGLKKYPDAGRAYSNALQIDPKNTAALLGIGKTYLAVGRKPQAMRAYEALKPLDADLAQQLLNEINKQ